MPKRMAVTHADLQGTYFGIAPGLKNLKTGPADLSPSRPTTGLGSKTGAFIMVLTILCGLFCFILSLIAEATRSKLTWLSSDEGEGGGVNECVYSGSGKTPLLCATSAFLGLAVIMAVEHGYMLFAISNSPPSTLVFWEPNYSGPAKSLKWQAAFFFVATWVCFATGEILLLIGVSVESGHLRKWSTPRPSCLVLRDGVLSAAGVFALTTVFLAAGLYLTAFRAQRISQQQETVWRGATEASILYASPPTSPPLTTIPRENPLFRESHIIQPPLIVNPTALSKHLNL